MSGPGDATPLNAGSLSDDTVLKSLREADSLQGGAEERGYTHRARAVRRYWDSLDSVVREGLLTRHPQELGNLEGIPYRDRYRANAAVMDAEFTALHAKFKSKKAQMTARVSFHGRAELVKYKELTDLSKVTTTELAESGIRSFQDRQFIVYDWPKGDTRGRIGEVLGNLEDAQIVVPVIPGMRNQALGFTKGHRASAVNIHEDTETRWEASGKPAPRIATVAWCGYTTPTALDATDEALAWQGAPRLASFLAGVNEEIAHGRHPDAAVRMHAHSYGTPTTALALRALRDDHPPAVLPRALMLSGSPGLTTEVTCVEDLGMTPGTVYAQGFPTDPVYNSGVFGHGGKPVDELPGIVNLDSGQPPLVPGENREKDQPHQPRGVLTEAFTTHTRYCEQETVALGNTSAVVGGLAEAVAARVVPPGTKDSEERQKAKDDLRPFLPMARRGNRTAKKRARPATSTGPHPGPDPGPGQDPDLGPPLGPGPTPGPTPTPTAGPTPGPTPTPSPAPGSAPANDDHGPTSAPGLPEDLARVQHLNGLGRPSTATGPTGQSPAPRHRPEAPSEHRGPRR